MPDFHACGKQGEMRKGLRKSNFFGEKCLKWAFLSLALVLFFLLSPSVTGAQHNKKITDPAELVGKSIFPFKSSTAFFASENGLAGEPVFLVTSSHELHDLNPFANSYTSFGPRGLKIYLDDKGTLWTSFDAKDRNARIMIDVPVFDVAVIQVDLKKLGLEGKVKPLKISKTSPLIGSSVEIVGYPASSKGEIKSSPGIVHGKDMKVANTSRFAFLSGDFVCEPGHSGSPIMNADNEVVGMGCLQNGGSDKFAVFGNLTNVFKLYTFREIIDFARNGGPGIRKADSEYSLLKYLIANMKPLYYGIAKIIINTFDDPNELRFLELWESIVSQGDKVVDADMFSKISKSKKKKEAIQKLKNILLQYLRHNEYLMTILMTLHDLGDTETYSDILRDMLRHSDPENRRMALGYLGASVLRTAEIVPFLYDTSEYVRAKAAELLIKRRDFLKGEYNSYRAQFESILRIDSGLFLLNLTVKPPQRLSDAQILSGAKDGGNNDKNNNKKGKKNSGSKKGKPASGEPIDPFASIVHDQSEHILIPSSPATRSKSISLISENYGLPEKMAQFVFAQVEALMMSTGNSETIFGAELFQHIQDLDGKRKYLPLELAKPEPDPLSSFISDNIKLFKSRAAFENKLFKLHQEAIKCWVEGRNFELLKLGEQIHGLVAKEAPYAILPAIIGKIVEFINDTERPAEEFVSKKRRMTEEEMEYLVSKQQRRLGDLRVRLMNAGLQDQASLVNSVSDRFADPLSQEEFSKKMVNLKSAMVGIQSGIILRAQFANAVLSMEVCSDLISEAEHLADVFGNLAKNPRASVQYENIRSKIISDREKWLRKIAVEKMDNLKNKLAGNRLRDQSKMLSAAIYLFESSINNKGSNREISSNTMDLLSDTWWNTALSKEKALKSPIAERSEASLSESLGFVKNLLDEAVLSLFTVKDFIAPLDDAYLESLKKEVSSDVEELRINIDDLISLNEYSKDRSSEARGLKNVSVAENTKTLDMASRRFLKLKSYLEGKGIVVVTPEGDIEKGLAYVGKGKRPVVRINRTADGQINEFVMWKEAFNGLMIEAIRNNPELGEEIAGKLNTRIRRDLTKNPQDIIGLLLKDTQDFTYKWVEDMLIDGISESEMEAVLERMRRTAEVTVKKHKARIIEVATSPRNGVVSIEEDVYLKRDPLAPIVDPAKFAAKDITSMLQEMSKPGMKERLMDAGKWSASKGFSLGHTVIFIAVLEIANKVKELSNMPEEEFKKLSNEEKMKIIMEAVDQVIFSMDIYTGLLGSTLTGAAFGKVLNPANLKTLNMAGAVITVPDEMATAKQFSRFKLSLAAQTLSVLTFAGWVVSSHLYGSVVEDIPEAHDIRNLLGNWALTKEVGSSLWKHIRTGEIRDSFEHAVFQGFLTGDTAFFLGFTAVGAKIGTVFCPAVGTAIGAFVGGLAGAVASIFIPEEHKSFLTDIFTNVGKWLGEINSHDARWYIKNWYVDNPDKTEELKDMMGQNRDARNRIIDSLLGIYTRNLQFWIVRDQLSEDYAEELSVFDEKGEFSPKRKYQQHNMKRNGVTVDHYFRERTPAEVRASIVKDIEGNEKETGYYRDKAIKAADHIKRVFKEEVEYFAGLTQKPVVASELADIEGTKAVMEAVLDIKAIEEEINADNLIMPPTITTAFHILAPLVQYGFNKERLEKTIRPLLVETSEH